jgi:hypothetical protein
MMTYTQNSRYWSCTSGPKRQSESSVLVTAVGMQFWLLITHICAHCSLISSGSFMFLPRNPTAYFNRVLYLNNWVMYPDARVSIKYWKTSVRNTVFFSAIFDCALLTLHVLRVLYSGCLTYFLCLRTTRRWQPNGAETCSVRSAQ